VGTKSERADAVIGVRDQDARAARMLPSAVAPSVTVIGARAVETTPVNDTAKRRRGRRYLRCARDVSVAVRMRWRRTAAAGKRTPSTKPIVLHLVDGAVPS
jgi:hypothetical protein